MEMYTDLRQFDKAKEFVVTTDKTVKQLVTKQADWFKTTNDPQAAWWVGEGGGDSVLPAPWEVGAQIAMYMYNVLLNHFFC